MARRTQDQIASDIRAQLAQGCDDCESRTRKVARYQDHGGIRVLCATCAHKRWH